MRHMLLAAVAAMLATSAAAQGRPEGWVRPGGQSDDAQMVAYIDVATLRREGDLAIADGMMVPRSGGLFPNYLRMRVEVDCVRRIGTMRGPAIHQPNGALVRALGQDSPPMDLRERDQPTLDLFCTENGANGLRAFTSTAQVLADARG